MFPINDAAKTAIDTLESHGFEAYCVGGAVRDLLMGKVPTDYDITTNALPQDVINIFPKTVATGIKHGTITVLLDKETIEITTYRTDGEYVDNRHPEKVQFVAGIGEDLSRRDFTVNAIAYSPYRGILDPLGGRKDIKNKIIKCVGQPEKRFNEDALRIMRCFRFASTLGFSIEKHTLCAAVSLIPLLQSISRERIFAELIKTLSGKHPHKASPLLGDGLELLERLPADAPARFAAWCALSGRDTACTAAALHSSAAFAEKAANISRNIEFSATDIFAVRKQVVDYGFESVRMGLIIGKEIFGRDIDQTIRLLEAAEKESFPLSPAHMALGGADLEALGLHGKQIGDALQKLFTMVLADPSRNTKEDLLKEAKNLIYFSHR